MNRPYYGDRHYYSAIFRGMEDNKVRQSSVVVTDGYSVFSDIPKILENRYGQPVFITSLRFIKTVRVDKETGERVTTIPPQPITNN